MSKRDIKPVEAEASAINSPEPVAGSPEQLFPSPESLRLPQHFLESVGVKKLLLNVPIRKPGPQEFVRVHPDEKYRINMLILELKTGDGRPEIYLVHPDMAGALEGELKMMTLFTTINRQGSLFFWPVVIPPIGGRQMAWHTSMREAAHLAMMNPDEIGPGGKRGGWLRIKANMSAGCYDVYVADLQYQNVQPKWPDDLPDLHGLLELAAKNGRLIKKGEIDHPALTALRGG